MGDRKIFIDEVIDLSKKITKEKMTKISPKKNWILKDGFQKWVLKPGEDIEVPDKFITSLVTEKVIS